MSAPLLQTSVRLDDRRGLRVAGPEAAHFLQNLVTSEIEGLGEGALSFGALLTPQGKILFDFFVLRESADAFLLDAPAAIADDLHKRLLFYRLRAKLDVEPAAITVVAGPDGLPDPRTSLLGGRTYEGTNSPGTAQDYAAARVAAGVPEGGHDFEYGQTFPHDVLMDRFETVGAGVATKGCYVGQEVVSRMTHRGTARRRTMRVVADHELASGAEVMGGDRLAGTLGTTSGREGLAILRLDRVPGGEAVVNGRPVRMEPPLFTSFDLPA